VSVPSGSTVVPPPPGAVAPPRAVPVAVPAYPKYASGPIPCTLRGRLTELAGSWALAPLIAALCTAPWALFTASEPWSLLGRVFLLATALSWAVLAVARPLPEGVRSGWGRRFHMLLVGMGIGLLAFWLDGWAIPRNGSPTDSSRDLVLWNNARVSPATFSVGMRYLFYFGLTVAAARWWRMTDPRRKERFRLLPIIGAGVWSAVFLFLWPWESALPAVGIAPVVIAAVCVQVASPWVPRVAASRPVARPVAYRRGRRYAV
jgi:hypothetical protein